MAQFGRPEPPPVATVVTPAELPQRTPRRAFSRVAAIAAALVGTIAATYVAPPLRAFRPWVIGGDYVPFWNVVGREWLDEEESLEAEARKVAELSRQALGSVAPESAPRLEARPKLTPPARAPVFPQYSPETRVPRPKHGIEPNSALDPYYRRLTLADLGVPGAVARAGHWGDSVLGVDGITSGIRRRLQSRFGDAGHGFHMMDRYNPSYQQQGIEFQPGGGWQRCIIVQNCSRQDRRYGYGGLIAQSTGGGAATWSTPKRGFGATVSQFEFWFAHQERGGKVEIVIDGREKLTVDTAGPHLEDGWQLVYVPPGPHSFTVHAVGGGNVRAYGVVFENDGPGVVWDGMALIGGSTRSLRTQQPEHIKNQIRRRGLDLVVFMFGGNDLQRNYVDLRDSMQPYYDEYGEVLKKFRAGKPDMACLVMSLTDHGKRTASGGIVSKKFVKQLSDAQREVARRNGCGFFDTLAATGGEGTAARWYRARPQLISPDLGHPNGLGHEVIAGLVANALLYGYEEYRERMTGKPLPELAAPPADDVQQVSAGAQAEGETQNAAGEDSDMEVIDGATVADRNQ